MKNVDLHPEELFDALRAGTLASRDRVRLEAHCAECSACLFELRWVDSPLSSNPVSEVDRAYGEAAFDNVLRANRRVQDGLPSRGSSRWPLHWGVGGLLLGTGLTLAFLAGPKLWPEVKPNSKQPTTAKSTEASTANSSTLLQQTAHAHAPAPAPAPELGPVPPSATAAPTANALLAAARSARTLGHYTRAAQLYRQVIAQHPGTASAAAARVALGGILADEFAQPQAAVRLFDDYLRQNPSGALAEEALYHRALSLERLGRRRQAQADFRRIANSFPDSLYTEAARARLAREPGE